MIQKSYDNKASLYLVPTPIGNLEDITFRAISVLKSVDIILCEDTRESTKLLKHYDINKKLIACHEFNEDKILDKVKNILDSGKNIALISDQGSPIISDPGFILARYLINNGYNVISLPGPTAFVPALSSSGIDPSPFIYYGFLNSKKSKREIELKKLVNYPYSIIFYEAPHRLNSTLKSILDIFGDRNISISREISKKYETIYRDKISNLIDNIELKGEFVIIVEGNKELIDYSELDIVEHVKLYLDDLSEMDAIKRVAKERGVSKSEIYKKYHDSK